MIRRADRHGAEIHLRRLAWSQVPRGESGGGGIRTHGPLARTPVFKTGAIDHSATPPDRSLSLGARRSVCLGEPSMSWNGLFGGSGRRRSPVGRLRGGG